MSELFYYYRLVNIAILYSGITIITSEMVCYNFFGDC